MMKQTPIKEVEVVEKTPLIDLLFWLNIVAMIFFVIFVFWKERSRPSLEESLQKTACIETYLSINRKEMMVVCGKIVPNPNGEDDE